MQFAIREQLFLILNLQFANFVWSKMFVKGIIMFLGMIDTRLERKILMILDFENGFLPTYLPQCAPWGRRSVIYVTHSKKKLTFLYPKPITTRSL